MPWQKAPGDHATLTAAARALARDVGEREAAEQQKLLADTGESQPADVGYAQPDLQFWRTDGGAQHGSLGTINTFYAGLHHGWLVILGEAGAGKTVLANQLLIDLISTLPPGDPPPGTTLTIPVRLSLPSFDPGDDPRHTQPATLSGRLDTWITRRLTAVHGLSPRTAHTLLQQG